MSGEGGQYTVWQDTWRRGADADRGTGEQNTDTMRRNVYQDAMETMIRTNAEGTRRRGRGAVVIWEVAGDQSAVFLQ